MEEPLVLQIASTRARWVRGGGAGVAVHRGVGLAREGGAVGVADREHPRALAASVADGLQRVGGLAGLADGDDEGGVVDDRVAVAELRGELDLDRGPRPVLDR